MTAAGAWGSRGFRAFACLLFSWGGLLSSCPQSCCSRPLIYPQRSHGVAQALDVLDTGGQWSILCGPANSGADTSWVPPSLSAPHPPSSSCSLLLQDHHGDRLVGVYHQEQNAPFLQGKGQKCPVPGWVPTENRQDKSLSPRCHSLWEVSVSSLYTKLRGK